MPVLNDDKKHANPRAGSVRIAADTMSGYSGQRRHDLRVGKPPKYVDEKRVHLNRVLITPPTPAEMREIAKARRARRETQRAMKSNAAIATAGIITFGSEAAQMFEALSQEDQDRAFRDLAEAVAAHLNTSLHALVVHLDEATIHAHCTLCAYDIEGVPLSRSTTPAILSALQDLTAEVLQRYCPEIERGTRYGDRLAAGAEWPDVIHKSVKQLHRELPADLAAKRAELEALEQVGAEAQDRINGLRTEVAKLDQTVERVSGDVAQLEDEKTRVEEELDDLIRDQEAAEVARDASERLAKIAHRERKERKSKAAAARAETRAVEHRLAGLTAAEAEARDRLAGLEEEEEAARKRVVEMQTRVDKLSDMANLTDKEVKRLATYQRRLEDRIAVLDAARDAAQAARDAATAETERAEAEAARVTVEAEKKVEEAATEVRNAEARKAELGQEIEELTVDAVAMTRVVDDRKAEAARLKTEVEEKARARDAAEADRVAAEVAAAAAAEKARTETARASELGQEIEELTVDVVVMTRVVAGRKAEAARLKTEVEERARARDAAEADRVAAENAATAAAEKARTETARAAELGQQIEELTVDAVAMTRVVEDRKAEAARLKTEVEERARARDAADADRVEAENAAEAAAEKARTEEARAAQTRDRIGVVTDALGVLIQEITKGTLAREPDGRIRASEPDRLNAACPEIMPAIKLGAKAVDVVGRIHRDALAVRDATMRERKALETDQAALHRKQDELKEDQAQLERDRSVVQEELTRAQRVFNGLDLLLGRFVTWLRLPGLPQSIRDEGRELLGETAQTMAELKGDGPEM